MEKLWYKYKIASDRTTSVIRMEEVKGRKSNLSPRLYSGKE